MPGSPGIRPAPDLPPGSRAALVVATNRYEDPELSQLRAPAQDAESLAEVLGDADVGGFTVTRVIDQPEPQVRRAIAAFLSGRGVDELVVVYLSCHGLLDKRNRLYFSATDTFKTRLTATGLSSAWLLDELDECRARRQVLILDCCFSGAFAHGGKGDEDLDLERRLVGQSRGRAVLTASRAGEYSYEGQALLSAPEAGSVFTTGLVDGLRTGSADLDGDGHVSLDEAYDHAFRYVRANGAAQTPQRWLYGGEGLPIVLARSPGGVVIVPAVLPDDLQSSLESGRPHLRIGGVNTLGEWLAGPDPAKALAAEQVLLDIAAHDIPVVAAAARARLRLGHEQQDRAPAEGQQSVAESPGSAADSASAVADEERQQRQATEVAGQVERGSQQREAAEAPTSTAADTTRESPTAIVPVVGPASRLSALLVDVMPFYIIALITNQVTEQANLGDDSVRAAAVASVLALIYFAAMWSWSGQSFGMMLLRVRVTRRDGASIRPVRAAIRALAVIVSLYLFPAAIISAVILIGGTGYTLHDFVTDTVVSRAA